MPKVVDTNGAEWGKSELNASGLLALGSADMADEFFSIGGRIPSTTQVNREQQKAQDEAKKNQERGDITTGGFTGVGAAGVNQVNTTIASLLTGQELDQDTFLARHFRVYQLKVDYRYLFLLGLFHLRFFLHSKFYLEGYV